MSKKAKIINVIVIVVVLGLVLYFSLKDNFEEIMKLIRNINPLLIILAILFFSLYRFFNGLSTFL